jgi:hypothetical protein
MEHTLPEMSFKMDWSTGKMFFSLIKEAMISSFDGGGSVDGSTAGD